MAWDAICLQESLRHCEAGVTKDHGCWLVSGRGTQVGAPMIILNPRLGSRLRTFRASEHHVIAQLGMSPPILIFSIHLPPASLGLTLFEAAIDAFLVDMNELRDATPGACLLGGGNCNTPLQPQKGIVGKHVGAIDRRGNTDRSDSLAHLLATLSLKADTTFSNYGPTRTPWAGQKQNKRGSVIDYIFTSTHQPTPVTQTNYSEIPGRQFFLSFSCILGSRTVSKICLPDLSSRGPGRQKKLSSRFLFQQNFVFQEFP